jgi:hypothetical protein
MKSARTTAAVAAGSLVLAIVAGSPASAGEPAPTGMITVEPTSGPPGTEFAFSGEGCVSDAGPGVMHLSFFLGEDLIEEVDPGFVPPDEGGNWVFGLVPSGFDDFSPVGVWHVTATCTDAETDQVLVDYEPATFEVTALPTPPTVPESPEAPPAAPVPAGPSFTG